MTQVICHSGFAFKCRICGQYFIWMADLTNHLFCSWSSYGTINSSSTTSCSKSILFSSPTTQQSTHTDDPEAWSSASTSIYLSQSSCCGATCLGCSYLPVPSHHHLCLLQFCWRVPNYSLPRSTSFTWGLWFWNILQIKFEDTPAGHPRRN